MRVQGAAEHREGRSVISDLAPLLARVALDSDRAAGSLIHALPFGVGVLRDGCFGFANKPLANLFGRSEPSALCGKHLIDLVDATHRDCVEKKVLAATAGQRIGPWELRGGRTLEIRLIPCDVFDEAAVLCVARDVSEELETSARRMQVDRMASAGLLAAGIGHEINNPLSFVSGNVDLALRTAADLGSYLSDLPPHRLDPDTLEALVHVETTLREMQEALADARQGARRIQAIARDLATFSRPERTEGAVEIERVLDATLHLSLPELRLHARLMKRYSGGTIVIANEAQLGQIFLNLVTNAVHAIPPGNPEQHEISVRVESDGDTATIEVSDSGSGIAEEHLPRVFDPFFTTKRLGEGTGLGLSIARNLVTSFGGEIDVRSQPGATTVRVRLPLSRPLATTGSSTVTPLGTLTRAMSVLVVDDEPLIGRVVARCVGRGHHIHFVTSGREALALLESDRHFDVVLLDVMMPEMTGIEVYRALEVRAPHRLSRVAFLTGGAFTAESRQFLETSTCRWLAKPFEARTIRGLVEEIGAVGMTADGPVDPAVES